MNHRYTSKRDEALSSAACVIALFAKQTITSHSFFSSLKKEDQKYLLRVEAVFSKKYLDIEKYVLPSEGGHTVFIVGLGEKEEYSLRRLTNVIRKLVQTVKQSHIASLAMCIDDFCLPAHATEKVAETIAVNVELAHYAFNRYLEAPKEGWPLIQEIRYYSSYAKRAKHLAQAVQSGSIIGEQTNYARELANTPGGDMTPKMLAKEARQLGEKYGASVKVLEEKDMRTLKMGGILGVSRGSKEDAQFIILEYFNGPKSKKPFVFVGKGITFDSGGLHLKPSNAMDEMHMDMSGGAAVINAIVALARMKLKVNVIGLIPAVENMPSGESYRPGDVLRSMSGKTIEVVSPDAEGRIVLADALTYAERYEPALVVDVATLTGACMIALGRHASAILSPQEKFIPHLQKAGEESGDYVWNLPLWEEYEADIKGGVGDILNAGKNRDAGTINGAAFLWQFAKKFPLWAHCDIASTMLTSPDLYLARGSRGSGTRLLIEIARSLWGKGI